MTLYVTGGRALHRADCRVLESIACQTAYPCEHAHAGLYVAGERELRQLRPGPKGGRPTRHLCSICHPEESP